MPADIESMFARAPSEIAYQEKTGLQRNDPAPVHDRGRKPRIAIVACNEEVEGFSGDPLFGFGVSELLPGERAGRFRLARSVYPQRAVHCCAAEHVAFGAVADVLERARIDQQRVPLRLQAEAERIGVAVAGGLGTLRTGIDHQLTRGTRSTENVETRRLQSG